MVREMSQMDFRGRRILDSSFNAEDAKVFAEDAERMPQRPSAFHGNRIRRAGLLSDARYGD